MDPKRKSKKLIENHTQSKKIMKQLYPSNLTTFLSFEFFPNFFGSRDTVCISETYCSTKKLNYRRNDPEAK